MPTLTFDYSQSYRGVHHEVEFFDAYRMSGPTVLACGWNNKPFITRPYNWHASDGTVTPYYDYAGYADPHNFGAPATVPTQVALFHAPAPDHFDIWTPYGNPTGLYLRVSETVSPPPNWDNYVLPDYYWDGRGPSAPRYASTDETAWANDLHTWAYNLPSLAFSLVTHAVLGDYYGNFGTVDADSPMFDVQLLDIENNPTIVEGSPHGDIIEGGAFSDVLNGGGGDDRLIGKGGGDYLDGGPGADNFVYNNINDSRPRAHDVILDFHHHQDDKIELHIDGDQRRGHPGNQGLVFIGDESFAQHYASDPLKHVGMVRVTANNVVQINVNGNFAPDMTIVVHGSHLHADDFDLKL
jgi:hypothetical protein